MDIDISYYEYKTNKVDRNYRIVHLSDYHSNNKIDVAKEVVKINPDFIVFTGDLIDRRRYDIDIAMELIDELKNICVIYYVSGNHEAWSDHYDDVKKELLKRSVFVLEDDCFKYDNLNIVGLKDFGFDSENGSESIITSKKSLVLKNNICKDCLNILLVHRPELIEEYSKYNYDLIFSGHAHGGQFRFFNQGLYAPNQGVFPKYTAGRNEKNNSTLFISRGLGNSRFPIRIFNNFEIIVVDIVEG
jgi:predicted MPP superfamily phosphohydrolase